MHIKHTGEQKYKDKNEKKKDTPILETHTRTHTTHTHIIHIVYTHEHTRAQTFTLDWLSDLLYMLLSQCLSRKTCQMLL